MQAPETPQPTTALRPEKDGVAKRQSGTVLADALASMTLARIISLNLVLLSIDVIGHVSLNL
jgi:hypothetical protein